MPHADLGDVAIHYQEAGEGPLAFVHCHGLGADGDAFAQEFDFWRGHFGRVLSWDNRGLGRSAAAAKYSLPLYAGDLARLLEKLGIERAVVHGVSWGGVVALQFVLAHPELCAAIIVDSSSSEVNVPASEGWYRQGEEARSGRGGERTIKPEHQESFIASARTVAGLREHPLTPRLKDIACPALIVAGGQDRVTAGPGGSVIMARHIPNSALHIIDDGDHALYSNQRDEFRSLVMAFAKTHGMP